MLRSRVFYKILQTRYNIATCGISRIFVCSFLARQPPPQWARASSIIRFLDHTQRRTTVGRTPLDDWSARRRVLNLTTHNTHNRRRSILLVGFEPKISASERKQTYVLGRPATGTDCLKYYKQFITTQL